MAKKITNFLKKLLHAGFLKKIYEKDDHSILNLSLVKNSSFFYDLYLFFMELENIISKQMCSRKKL